jgi:plastocyanin
VKLLPPPRAGHGLVAGLAALTLLLATSSASSAALVSVDIVDAPRPQAKWGYAPGSRKVPVDSWVTWSNNGVDAHTVTALDGSFDSGNLDPSEGFSWYFDRPGTFDYLCAWHPWMTGKIVVGDGVAAALTPATEQGTEPLPPAAEPDQADSA